MQDNCRDCGRKNCICKSLQNQSLAGFSDARDRLRTSAQCEATVLALNDLLNESQKNAMLVIADRDRLRAELEASRRQIDDARKDGYAIGLMDAKDMLSDTESPIAWQYRDKNSDWHTINLVRNKHQRDWLEKNSDRYELRPLYAAPVPPQPSAVPEAVAKDAARYRFLKDNPAFLYFPSSGIWRLHLNQYSPNGVADTQEEAIDAAILSAADDEVKKCAHVIPCPDVCGDNTNSTATEGRKDE